MKKNLFRRIATIATAAALSVGAGAMFAGCSSNNPEITITYSFNGEEYEVSYTLSRLDAPNTVQHFIELADAGYYDGMCVHDYDSNYIRSGGYKFVEGELEAVNYFTEVKKIEAEQGITFTQSVWKNDADQTPLYTVYGEFEENGNFPANGREYKHKRGALVMDYSEKNKYSLNVRTVRNDGGADNDGEAYDLKAYYKNSATSLFYTFLGESSTSRDSNYCVFGMVSDADELEALIDAVKDYVSDHSDEDTEEEYSFTENITKNVNEYEPFEDLCRGDITKEFKTPVTEPIIIQSVKVNKY